MKPRILFGLGNPGAEYENTPHNIGSRVVRAWAAGAGLTFVAGAGPFAWTEVRRGVRAVIPSTYMNVCGRAVAGLVSLTELHPDELLVVTDDVWLPLGRLRLRSGGSDGGHNGLKSVAEALGTEKYPRLRIGVGPVPEGKDWADFVLADFPPTLQAQAKESVASAVDALHLILALGVQDAQGRVNRLPAPEQNNSEK